MGQRIVRALAVCALAGVALAPVAVAGASTGSTGSTGSPAAGTANRSASTAPTPGTQQAWDEALKTAPHAVARPAGPSNGSSGAANAAAASPVMTVTPATDLVRGQVVSVTGTGLGTGDVVLVECTAAADPAFRCDYRTALFVPPDASGAIAANFTVRRFIRGTTDRIDCASAPDACDLVVSAESSAVLARHALAFDPTAPIAHPAITVTPSTGLLAGQNVTVTATGFLAGDFVRISECATVDPYCSGSGAYVAADANGALSASLTVRLRVTGGTGVVTHCLAVDCIVRAESSSDLEYRADAPLAFDPGQPLPPVPTITVTSSTGLLHDQTVTITGTGFDPNGNVEINECGPGSDTYCSDYLTSHQVDASGGFTTTAVVSRLVSNFLETGTTIADCATAPCRIQAVGYTNDEDFQLVASVPISFDSSVPPPAPPIITVTPSTNLPYRTQVAVHGTGFRPGESIYAAFCATTAQGSSCGYTYGQGSADSSGTVDLTLVVKRRTYVGNVDPLDCIDAGTECSVTVYGERNYERTQVAVTFAPNAVIPPPPAATVTPDHNLGYRQGVTLAGSGFAPGAVEVQQCGRVNIGGSSFETCEGTTQIQADAAGVISGTAQVRRIMGHDFGVSIDCATSADPCTLKIGSGDPDESAVVPLGFDPNSQPPPPPVVVISPSTHVRDGQQVTVGGLGFTAGATLGMAPCKAGVTQIADACDIGRASVVTTDVNGAFLTTKTVAGVIQTSQGPVDCTAAANTCVLAFANAADLTEFALAPLSFDAPELQAHSTAVTEGTGTMTPAEVMVELSAPIGSPTTVEWQAVPGTAGTDDYMPGRGRVTIPAGATEAMIHMGIVGDTLDEPTERFTVRLTSALGARITDGTATVKIRDDDHAPSVSIMDGRSAENRGPAHAEVLLSAPSAKTIVVHYVTHHGSARADTDYVRKDSSLTFLPGQTRHVIRVTLVDDHAREPAESFRIELGRVENADIGDDTGIVTITDDD